LPLSSIQIIGLLSGSVIINTTVTNILTLQEVDEILLSARNDSLLNELNKAFGNKDDDGGESAADKSHSGNTIGGYTHDTANANEIVYLTRQALQMNVIIEQDITTVHNLAEGIIPMID